jgi:cytochrome c-type biogenesis protein CcmH
MLAFLFGAVALVALALAFVLPTLWKDARRSAVVLGLAVPFGAVALYVGFGTPDALDPANLRPPETPAEAVAQSRRAVQRDPERFEAWALLGNAHLRHGEQLLGDGANDLAREQFAQALDALQRARGLSPDDPNLKVDIASATLLSATGEDGVRRAAALFDEALDALPDHPGALMLGGVAALRIGEAATAIERWERLIPMVGDAEAATLRRLVAGARGDAGAAPGPDVAAVSEPGTPGTLTVTIDADPAALAALPPGAVLFVFARDANAGGPPVAAQRHAAARLPLTVTLSDADRLMPTAALSAATTVEVSARFSARGTVTPDPQDLVAPPVVVSLPDAAPITLRLAPAAAAAAGGPDGSGAP